MATPYAAIFDTLIFSNIRIYGNLTGLLVTGPIINPKEWKTKDVIMKYIVEPHSGEELRYVLMEKQGQRWLQVTDEFKEPNTAWLRLWIGTGIELNLNSFVKDHGLKSASISFVNYEKAMRNRYGPFILPEKD